MHNPQPAGVADWTTIKQLHPATLACAHPSSISHTHTHPPLHLPISDDQVACSEVPVIAQLDLWVCSMDCTDCCIVYFASSILLLTISSTFTLGSDDDEESLRQFGEPWIWGSCKFPCQIYMRFNTVWDRILSFKGSRYYWVADLLLE